MTTFIAYFILGSFIGIGINYILMVFTDDDD